MIECLFWNSNWCLGMKFLSSTNDFNCFKRSFTNNFDKIGQNDIGLYEITFSEDFPDLNSTISFTLVRKHLNLNITS